MTRGKKQILLTVVLGACMAVLILSITILASVPPVSRDALTHHLAVPKLWLQQGGIYEIPDLPVSYYPMNLDLLYIVPLFFGNDIIPKYIHFAFALATAWLIFLYLNRRLNRLYALTGALMFLSIPVIIKLSITVYVDLGLIFFSTLSILSLFRWIKVGHSTKHLLLSGVSCGLAMGTKYNGLIVFFLLSLMVPFMYMRSDNAGEKKSQYKAVYFFLVFVCSSLLFFSPWMMKNYAWTGNPIYPLLGSFFSEKDEIRNDPTAKEDPETVAWGHFNVRKYVFKETAWETLTTPVRIFFQGRDDEPKYFDGKLNPFLLLLPLPAFMGLRRDTGQVRKEKLLLASFSFLYLMIVYFQADMRIRYMAPILPPLAILAIFGLFNLKTMVRRPGLSGSRRILNAAAPMVVVTMFYLNGAYLIGQFSVVDPLPYIRGHQDRNAYITHYRPEFGVIQHINTHLPEDSRILAVFLGRRGYYSNREMIFDFSFIEKSVRVSDDPELLYREFILRGITHLMIRYDLFNQWAGGGAFKEMERRAVSRFLSTYTELIHTERGHGLYRIVQAPGDRS